tara:strand:+ start:2317 stop:2844 length:528 start_codon:yes stop_codon:yes gene_type:complete
MKNLLKALSAFQNEVPTIHEETKGFNYTYSNLNSIFKVIKPLLKKHGLGFYQNLDARSLVTTVFHVESGEQIQSSSAIPEVTLKGMNDYQTLGSGITYLRRYSLSVILCLITDKDVDACGTQEPKKPTFTAKHAQGEKLKGTEGKDLKEKYIITDIQIEKYNQLKTSKDGSDIKK